MSKYLIKIVEKIVYKHSPDVDLAPDEIDVLNQLASRQVIPVLKNIFDKEQNDDVKSRAFIAILSIIDYDKVGFLLDLLDQSTIDWQLAYCRRLSQFQDKRAVEKLCDILLNNPNPDMRYTAAQSLAVIGTVSAVPTLEYAQTYDSGTDFEGFPISYIAGKALKSIQARCLDGQDIINSDSRI